MKHTARAKGFTFIELAITVAIVGLLATLVLPMAELVLKRDQEHELRSALREIRGALDAYKRAVDEGRITVSVDKSSGYPPSLRELVDGVKDAKSPDQNGKIYFLRRIPRDPLCLDSTRSDEETWGKRSYESGPDAPAEGDDVFDVYSLSNDVGLNGISYKDW
ncbi:MAG TPA: type II secretion system protein [Moraxellaceae bacterium]|nr:type II secretion system protein [Moraxellaceae bacterium]